jgi:hypothetical protein
MIGLRKARLNHGLISLYSQGGRMHGATEYSQCPFNSTLLVTTQERAIGLHFRTNQIVYPTYPGGILSFIAKVGVRKKFNRSC